VRPDESEVSIIVMDKLMENMILKNIRIHGFFISHEIAGIEDKAEEENKESCILVALENYSN
jgi:hypothetical protein